MSSLSAPMHNFVSNTTSGSSSEPAASSSSKDSNVNFKFSPRLNIFPTSMTNCFIFTTFSPLTNRRTRTA
eukprot:CAMPEP_0169296260 /NCGR_PEP_ID=MMETSP1016-20121227/65052_1 /TAXON_ID=342587 /ORGANISM="Karlodinium micrum, Strain CCMP2283" /LENGTH=69 /DNA_ID=CAMNT_0009387653 /DNA_START=12 /DNA_END=218 /DNA_ORIENTATION=+